MLDRTSSTLVAAYEHQRAVGAFNTYSIEITAAILQAAAETAQPLIVQMGSSAFPPGRRGALVAATIVAAQDSAVPVGVHLDHCRDLDEIRYCLSAGVTSVMVDGSHLSFEANVELTRQAVDQARPFGAWVEGELGALPGDEDRSGHVITRGATVTFTDPALAADFVARTGVDCLAVAVGNVHGLTREPVELDLGRLSELREAVDVPLALHGASGLPDEQLLEAVGLGAAKINFNTELRQAFLAALDGRSGGPALSYADTFAEPIRATTDVVRRKVGLLRGTQITKPVPGRLP